MKILYFSSTGNNIYISEQIGGKLYSIPILLKNEDFLIEDDIVGIVFPVYFYSIPKIVGEYVKKLNINADYVFTVCSYGSAEFGAYRALNTINKLLKKQGIAVNYSNCVCMVDNYLPMFDIAEELKIKKDEEIDRKIELIKEDILNGRNLEVPEKRFANFTIGNYPIEKTLKTIHRLKVADGCTNCKICTKICPRGNIELIDHKPVIGDNCEFCLGCVHHCRYHVISTNKEKSGKRYLNKHIKLNKIFKSNNKDYYKYIE